MHPFINKCAFLIVLFCFPYLTPVIYAQEAFDSSNKTPINIINNRTFESFQQGASNYFKFIGDVQFQHGSDFLFCDTAVLNQQKNSLVAYGNVKIVQADGTTALSDYLSYTGNVKKAYLKGNVSLISGSDELITEELDYNLNTKVGNYYKNGTLTSGSTTVSSDNATYNAQTKDSRFTGNVLVNDTAYNIESNDLGYNTDSKVMRFYDATRVDNKGSILISNSGVYDSKNQIAHFDKRSSVFDKGQFIEGDSLNYDKIKGLGDASGNVIVIDTAEKATIYCGKAFYNENQKTILATIKPVLKKQNDNDSTFIRADTFYSAHTRYITLDSSVVRPTNSDTLETSTKKKKEKRKKTINADTNYVKAIVYTTLPDTTSPKYYSGFHNVKIFSDSMQGKCDSICFTGKDSVMLMMGTPIMWSRNSQITGDTIISFIDSGQIKQIKIPNDALVISQTGPIHAEMYNQIQSRSLNAYLTNNELEYAIFEPDAQCIYYPKDEVESFIGVNEATGAQMKVNFKNGEISFIYFYENVTQKLSPIHKINIQQMRLNRFQWLESVRPKTLEELFD
jgi:lipopolysaccharide export system protein LptA